MKVETLQDMIENTIKDLEKVEEKYYNAYGGNIYMVALYLYGRYGELPSELMNDTILQNISDYIRKQETLFNENINMFTEEYIFQNS